ncbi:hypothetical protein [Streptomyces sp. CBMA156]|uniref:hypothetical protein n=1 Tax=Streptomyces sp. CBMA156 TaxID=1930280 RepID=UPI001661E74D|nr:hypothetical protein [Streptomyces sp. CBMA156]MBD0675669.1 hypothetical protein [Streptomyces sp. CBMA156]
MTITESVTPAADDEFDAPLTNPFPGADKFTWTLAFSEALGLETGLPPLITDAIAAFVVRPKNYLTRQRGQQTYRMRPGLIVPDLSTGLRVLTVRTHGFAGTPTEYNERVRSTFDSPAQPDPDPERTLPMLVTGDSADGTPLPYLTTAQPVPAGTLNSLLGIMDTALDKADSDRPYDLSDNLRTFGQNTSTLHVPLLRSVAEVRDGRPATRQILDLVAITGSNRSRARLKLHGLTAEQICFGIPTGRLFLPDPKPGEPAHSSHIADPSTWVPAYANALRDAYEAPGHLLHGTARAAAMIATVQLKIIVGTDNLGELHNTVFDPNRTDHRHPPLDYPIAEKSSADMRAVLRDATTRGRFTEAWRAWLAGEAPAPEGVPDTILEARDLRDRTLWALAFPEDREHDREVAQVLGEPRRSSTGAQHVALRLRMVSAAIALGYRNRWNPRLIDGVFGYRFIMDGHHQAKIPHWADALAAAAHSTEDLRQFLNTRGLHWLAEHDLIEADRGSADAQKAGRRSGVNARNAMLAESRAAQAVGLLWEIARANQHGSPPRQVDAEGAPIEGSRADQTWFNRVFPKVAKAKSTGIGSGKGSRTDSTPPNQPPPSKQQVLVGAQNVLVHQATSAMPSAVLNLIRAVRQTVDAGLAAGEGGLQNMPPDSVSAVFKAVSLVQQDLRNLQSTLLDMQHGPAAVVASEVERFLNEAAEGTW